MAADLKTIAIAIGAGLLLFSAGYGVGRYLKPARMETQTVTKTEQLVSYRDRIVYRKAADAKVHTVEVVTKKADGETTTTKTTDTDYHSTTASTADATAMSMSAASTAITQISTSSQTASVSLTIGPEYRLRSFSLKSPDISASLAWKPTPLPVILHLDATAPELDFKKTEVVVGMKLVLNFL